MANTEPGFVLFFREYIKGPTCLKLVMYFWLNTSLKKLLLTYAADVYKKKYWTETRIAPPPRQLKRMPKINNSSIFATKSVGEGRGGAGFSNYKIFCNFLTAVRITTNYFVFFLKGAQPTTKKFNDCFFVAKNGQIGPKNCQKLESYCYPGSGQLFTI